IFIIYIPCCAFVLMKHNKEKDGRILNINYKNHIKMTKQEIQSAKEHLKELLKKLDQIESKSEEIIKDISWNETIKSRLTGNIYYYLSYDKLCNFVYQEGKISGYSKIQRKSEHMFYKKEHADFMAKKLTLIQEMHAFAHVRNL